MSILDTLRQIAHRGGVDYSPDGFPGIGAGLKQVTQAIYSRPAGEGQATEAGGTPTHSKTDEQIMAASVTDLTDDERRRRSELNLHWMANYRKDRTVAPSNAEATEKWKREKLDEGEQPEIEKTLAALVGKPGKKPKRKFETNITGATAPDAAFVPFYHQIDSRGNSWAGLRKRQDEAKGRKAKLDVREAIYAWAAEFDAQQRGEKQRGADGSAGDPTAILQWKAEKTKQQSQDDHPKEAALKAQLADQIVDQIDKPKPATTPRTASSEPTERQKKLDLLQAAMDVVGAFDPTPVVDGTNAGISAIRAYREPERRKEHLRNVGISTVSMIPYIGDSAKLLKVGDAAKVAKQVAKKKRQKRFLYRLSTRGASRVIGDDEDAMLAGIGSGAQPPGDPPEGDGGSGSGDDDQQPEGRRNRFLQAVESGAGKVTAFVDKLMSATGPIGRLAMTAGKTAIKVGAMIKGLEVMNTGIIALNRNLAGYSGGMAGAYAVNDMRNLQRDVRKAEQLDEPMRRLIEEQADLKDSLDQFMVPIQAVLITGVAKLTELVNVGGEILNKIPAPRWVTDLIQAISGGEGAAGTPWQQFFRDVSDGRFDGDAPDFASDLKSDQKANEIAKTLNRIMMRGV